MNSYIIGICCRSMHESGIKYLNEETSVFNYIVDILGFRIIKWKYSSFGDCYFMHVDGAIDIRKEDSIRILDTKPKDFDWNV